MYMTWIIIVNSNCRDLVRKNSDTFEECMWINVVGIVLRYLVHPFVTIISENVFLGSFNK